MRLIAGWISGVVLVAANLAQASTFQVFIDTTPLSGMPGSLAFDFIDGGPPSNSVTISNFISNGTLGAPTSTGGVSGALPGAVQLTDTSFFNEYLTTFTFGTSISFLFTPTANPPASGSSPDEFALYFLNPAGTASLVATSDPTGANAVFDNGSDGSQDIYVSAQETTTIAPVSATPEPSSFLLLCGAAAALLVLRIRRKFAVAAVLAILPLAAFAQTFSFTKIVDTNTPRPDGQGNFALGVGNASPPVIDGNWVAFMTACCGNNGLEIWSYNLASQQFTKLVDFTTPVPGSSGGGHFADFAVCGNNIAAIQLHDGALLFTGADSSAPICNFGHEGGLYTVPVQGGPVSRVVDYNTILPGSGGTFKDVPGAYAKSVSQGVVAFEGVTSNGDQGVWSAGLDGSNLQRIADDNTVYTCPPGSHGGCPNLYANPNILAGNIAFTGGGTFGAEGWNGLFLTPVNSPVLNPALNSTQPLPGDPGPDNPQIPDTLSDFQLPAIDGNSIYFTATDPNFAGSCGGGTFTGIFQTALSRGTIGKIADTCDTLPVVGTLNGANSFESLAAGGGLAVFQVMDSNSKNSLYSSLNGVLAPVVSQGGTLLGNTVYALDTNVGNNSVSQARLAFTADVGPLGVTQGVYLATPSCMSGVSSQVTVTPGGFRLNRANGQFDQQVMLTNTGASAISGPIALVIENLSSNATLSNASGASSCTAAGSPYINVPLGAGNSLAPGANVSFTLAFSDPSRGSITYNTAVTAGAGTP